MVHITKNLTTYRIVLLMAILCCGCLNLSAHNVLTGASNLFRDSDIVMMQPMDYSWAGDEGENVVWNFSAVRESKGEHSIEFHAGSLGAIQKIEDDNIYTYYYRDSSLYQTGFENRLWKINYKQPKLVIGYPFQSGDSICASFSGYGTYCGDHNVAQLGQVCVLADGYGSMALSAGDMLRNVLRVYTLTTTSMAMDMDTAVIDSSNLRQVIEERYDWYARGYRYPVYTTIVSTSYANLQPVAFKKAAYRLSVDESQLLADEVNDSIKQVDSRAETEQETIDKDIFHYQVHQNGRMVSVDYILDEPATVTSLISDVMGMVYHRSSFQRCSGEYYTLTFDCSGLRQGQYILYINVNGRPYSEHIAL